MTADPRADLNRDFSIKMAILRQRSPWVLRDLMHRDRSKQERAQQALVDVLASCANRYDIDRSDDVKEAPHHSTP